MRKLLGIRSERPLETTQVPYRLPEHMIGGKAGDFSAELLERAKMEPAVVLKELKSRAGGLTDKEVRKRLKKGGHNEISKKKGMSPLARLWSNIADPLSLLLIVLGSISFFTGDERATVVIFSMVVVGVGLRFFQEMRADNAAEKLKAMIRTTATVVRNGKVKEVQLRMIAPGDVIQLAAGDMIPADVRLLSSKDLFVNQAALTGEAVGVEKHVVYNSENKNPLELQNICFLGSSVESGAAMAVVVHTGDKTYFGSLASTIATARVLTNFDKGINQFTWLMIRFMMVMVPFVFLVNGLLKHNWFEAFMFAMAVAVGLTPEMLPMIVNVNLAKGALAMSKKKVIVKRLNSIQNFGAMNVLCTDKTGTLTQGKVVLQKHLDPRGNPSERVLHYAYLNSVHHTGLKNLMDDAILEHEELAARLQAKERYKKIDEIPFDFVRRRMSVVVEDKKEGQRILICKGAVNEVLERCVKAEIDERIEDVRPEMDAKRRGLVAELNSQGFRVVAVGYKVVPTDQGSLVYNVKDECGLVLLGFLAFLDPPQPSAAEALKNLKGLGLDVKVLTGDNEIVSAYICKEVGMPVENILVGAQIETMTQEQLADAAAKTNVFARLAPSHKERIIKALQSRGNVVGFMGDGINDSPALKAADVGISVNNAVDIAKESSDIILMENSLRVLEQGVKEGRRVFGNIIKYIKMAASSNFGNMFSVLGASAFLPFLPMMPLQLLTNNLLYDFSQTTIPTDKVDDEWLTKPRQWTIDKLQRFIFFVGPISSIFDYLTFGIMIWVFGCWTNPAMFQTGWFVESIFTQTLIVHVIRTNKIPFLQSWASWQLILSSLVIVGIGAWLPYSPLAGTLGFVPLPPLFWGLLAVMLVCYVTLTQFVKSWVVKRWGE